MEAKLRKLKKMEHQMNEWTVDKKSWKVTGKIATSGGLMCIQAQVLLLSKDLNLIEIKRARGDILQYKTLIEELVKDMGDVMGDGAKTEPGGDNKTEA